MVSKTRNQLIENACIKLRKYKLATERVLIFLRSQDFHDMGLEMDLSGPTSFPSDILRVVSPAFEELFAPATLYRATGVILCKLSEASYGQLDLFGEIIRLQRLSNLYESIDTLREKYGKHTVFLGASFLAHTHTQHASERGQLPERQHALLPGETARNSDVHGRGALACLVRRDDENKTPHRCAAALRVDLCGIQRERIAQSPPTTPHARQGHGILGRTRQ